MAILALGDYASTDDASTTDTAGNTVWPLPLGFVSKQDPLGRVHRYLRVSDDLGGGPTTAAGIPVGFDLAATTVTNFYTVNADFSDISPTLSGGTDVCAAGLQRNAVTDGRAAWIHIGGTNLDTVVTNGSIIEGGMFRWSDDRTIAPFADGAEEAVFGIARRANSVSPSGVGELIIFRTIHGL